MARKLTPGLSTKLDYIGQACRTLDFAHRRGVIRRDVKARALRSVCQLQALSLPHSPSASLPFSVNSQRSPPADCKKLLAPGLRQLPHLRPCRVRWLSPRTLHAGPGDRILCPKRLQHFGGKSVQISALQFDVSYKVTRVHISEVAEQGRLPHLIAQEE
jgi:hypothetical protein